jgi:hypothetical protein
MEGSFERAVAVPANWKSDASFMQWLKANVPMYVISATSREALGHARSVVYAGLKTEEGAVIVPSNDWLCVDEATYRAAVERKQLRLAKEADDANERKKAAVEQRLNAIVEKRPRHEKEKYCTTCVVSVHKLNESARALGGNIGRRPHFQCPLDNKTTMELFGRFICEVCAEKRGRCRFCHCKFDE